MKKSIVKNSLAVFATLILCACGGGASDQGGQSPWGQGPKPAQPNQPVIEQASQNQTGQEGENPQPKGHPAAEPQIPQDKKKNCGHMHPGGLAPQIISASYKEAIAPTFKQLCYRSFNLGHSGRTRTALWSAEVLDPRKMELASRIERNSSFKADERLPADERSELEDYRRSGFDRGHLAPSADMPSRESQEESFLLSNIVPQEGKMNGGVWRDLEMNVRKEAYRARVYVVTGPLFKGAKMTLKKRVLVPTYLYKAMYVVDKGAVVFIVSNDKNAETTTMSIDQFSRIYGLDPFPGLTGYVRQHNIALGKIPEEKITAKEDSSAPGSADGKNKSDENKQLCKMFMDKNKQWMTEDEFRGRYGPQEKPFSKRHCVGDEGKNK